jgi:GAF domain-containing protein
MSAVPGRTVTRARQADEKAYLYEIIRTIGSGPDLETVLRGIVRLVSEATGCHACFVYFVEGDRLVLRAASTVYAHLAGTISFPVTDGLAGWVVSTRRAAFIRDNALADPRFILIRELEEERFQSVVSVPVFSRAGDVIGVVTLHTEAPREFARADLDFLENTAALVAGAVENARLYSNAIRRVTQLTELSELAHDIAAAGSVTELLSTVTAGCRRTLDADRAEVYLRGPDDRLAMRAASPDRSEWPVLDGRGLRFDPLAVDSRHSSAADVAALARALWGPDVGGTPVFVPLVAGAERSGLLAVVCTSGSPDALSLLSAVASHTAVALRHHELIGRLREENVVKDFLDGLARGRGVPDELGAQGARLGFDLGGAHAVLHVLPWRHLLGGAPAPRRAGRRAKSAVDAGSFTWPDVVAGLEAALTRALPGTLFDARAASCRAVLPLPPGGVEELVTLVRAVHARVTGGNPDLLALGLSRVCRARDAYPRAFADAAAAAEIGALVHNAAALHTYDDLGPYRYILEAAAEPPDDQQARLAQVVDYDARRGSRLLHTLEVYLEARGNVVGSARLLHTHPNTLRQRLARIEELTGLDLENEDWLSLGIAVKCVKLRLARSAARPDEPVVAPDPQAQ